MGEAKIKTKIKKIVISITEIKKKLSGQVPHCNLYLVVLKVFPVQQFSVTVCSNTDIFLARPIDLILQPQGPPPPPQKKFGNPGSVPANFCAHHTPVYIVYFY